MASELKQQLTPASAVALIKPFFKNASWSNLEPEDVTVEPLKGGYCNSIYKVTRLTLDADANDGPASVVIKVSGGNKLDINQLECSNTYNAIMVFAYEMSKRLVN